MTSLLQDVSTNWGTLYIYMITGPKIHMEATMNDGWKLEGDHSHGSSPPSSNPHFREVQHQWVTYQPAHLIGDRLIP